MRQIAWAIRLTINGRDCFLRHGGVIGRGPIVTFHSKAKAEEQAIFMREGLDANDAITVIERSHGRRTTEANR